MLLDYLKDNIVLVIPSSIKKDILKQLNELKEIYNIKIMSKEQVIDALTFTYNEKAIYYLMHERGYKYDIALMYLNNIKYITDNPYDDVKLNDLVTIKKELESNNLLIYNPLLKKYLKEHNIIIYGYDYLSNYDTKILSECNYEVINKENKNYNHSIYEFNMLDDEVEFVATKIITLIKQGIDVNNIKIANINEEYYLPLKRIFDLYNIPLEDINHSSIFTTKIVQDFLTNLDINSINYDLTNEDNLFIYENIIKVLNKYSFVNDLNTIKSLLIEEFKSIKNKTIKKLKEVNIIDINNNVISDDDYVFYMNFNQGNAPLIIRDEDYLSNLEKELLGLETKDELNAINKKCLINSFNNIKNLDITYKIKSMQNKYEVSYLVDELNYPVIKDYKIDYIYSNKANKIKLASYLDQFIKYKNESDDLKILYSNYLDIPYNCFDNSFKGIVREDFLNFLDNKLYLSYSSIDNYYKCGFRFYLNNILKIDKIEDNFSLQIGNVFHSVLENVFGHNDDFEKSYQEAIEKYDFKVKDKFFLNKLKEDLVFIIDTIKYQNSFSSLDKILCEEKVYVDQKSDLKLSFVGVIDKLLYKEKDGITYAAIIDYKTGNPDINLNNVYYGLNMQLPIYIYLANNSKKIKNVKVIGFYLQKILHSKPKKEKNKSLLELKQKELKLSGYTNTNFDYVSMLDNNFYDSKVINSFNVTKAGNIDSRSRVLSDDQINKLLVLTERKIKEAFVSILDMDFSINPKEIDNKNIGCEYCPYKDICFKKDDDIKYLNKVDYKEFLKGGD